MDLPGLREALEAISHKWDIAILAQLRERPLRYSELRHRLMETASDLSEGVLSKNLKGLQARGLLYQKLIDDNHHVWDLTPRSRQMLIELARITDLQVGMDDPLEPPVDDCATRGTDSELPPTRKHLRDGKGGATGPSSDLGDDRQPRR